MTYVYLTQLADEYRAAGLKVVEIDGWKSRGRPASTGGFNPVGSLFHHTGDKADGKAYAEWLATVGRSDLPAPLCQKSIGRDGTVYICAAGRANHAGVAKAVGSVAGGDGNELYVGTEVQNTGTEGYPKAQYDAMVTVAAVDISRITHTSVRTVAAHYETSTEGKWDPGMPKAKGGVAHNGAWVLNMETFRADVAARAKDLAQSGRKKAPAPAKPVYAPRVQAELDGAQKIQQPRRRKSLIAAIKSIFRGGK